VLCSIGLLALGNRISISVPFLIGCLGVLADTFLNTGFAALRARQRNSMVALTQFTLPALLLMLLLLLQSSARAVLSPLLLIALQSAISWVVVLVLYWRGRRPQINLRVVAFGAWAFVIADLLANIYGQSATLQLRAAAGVLEVGLFRPALNILNVTYIMPAIVFSVSLPLLSSPTTSRPNYLRIVRLWVLGALGYGLLVGLGLNFGAPLIMTLVYDPRFAASAPILQVLSPATLFKVSSFACTLVMLSRNRQTLRIALQTIAVVLNVVLGAWIIPSYGLRGAAWITLGTEIVLFLLYAGGALWALKTWKDPITLKQTSTPG
jgi:O-antigen/teichoic acid export membrane protein